MRVSSKFLASLVLVLVSSVAKADPIVPALIIFGDFVVDVGNNNNLNTLIKANFPTYGRDFASYRPTGRFCNGKLSTDFTAEYMGFTSYQPPYLSSDARGEALLTGANFASAASGFLESRRACCGTGTLETSLLCNGGATGTCTNVTSYVFWDGFHPPEAANQVLAGNLLAQEISLIS